MFVSHLSLFVRGFESGFSGYQVGSFFLFSQGNAVLLIFSPFEGPSCAAAAPNLLCC